MPADRQASPVGVSELEAPLTQLPSKERFSSIRYAIACRSWRSNQPLKTASTTWRADASITAAVHNTQPKSAVRTVSAELWDSTGVPEGTLIANEKAGHLQRRPAFSYRWSFSSLRRLTAGETCYGFLGSSEGAGAFS